MKSAPRFQTTQIVITVALIVVLAIAALPLGSNRPVSWLLLAFVVFVMFVIQIAVDAFRSLPRQSVDLLLPGLLFLIVVVWAIVQIMPGLPQQLAHPSWHLVGDAIPRISADPGQGRHGILRYLCYAMIFWIAFRCATSKMRAGLLLMGFALFSTMLAVFGIYAAATGQNIFLGEGMQSRAVTATFVNRNNYATYAIFGVLANIAAYLHVVGKIRLNNDRWETHMRDLLERFFSGAWVFALGALICLTALGLTQSRAGGISGVIGLAVFASIWQKGSSRRNLWVWGALAIAVVFVALTNAGDMTGRLLATSGENNRFVIYPQVITGIADRPFLGHGLGAFADTFRAYVPAEAAVGEWVRAHNSFLENAYELGVPAAVAFYAALGLITFRIYRGTRQRSHHRVYSCFAFSCVVAGAAHSLLDFSLQIPAVAAAFAMILALGWTQSFRSHAAR